MQRIINGDFDRCFKLTIPTISLTRDVNSTAVIHYGYHIKVAILFYEWKRESSQITKHVERISRKYIIDLLFNLRER